MLGDDLQNNEINIQRHQQVYINWKAPTMSWFALNTDSAVKGNPRTACGGGIIRDCQGKMYYVFSVNFGICSAFRAEMKAIEIGIDLAKKMGIQKLMIQMDNKYGIFALQSSEPYGRECIHIVQQCQILIKNHSQEVKLFHYYREDNRATNWLANQGVLQTTKLDLIQVPPLELDRLLHQDLVGVAWPRLVSS